MFSNTKADADIYNNIPKFGQDDVLIEAACLSTDAKPTDGVANGSECIEMDTGKKFMFNKSGGNWLEVNSGGGGGSSLPAVTSDDNGDVLTVVNGAWDKASPSGDSTFLVNESESTLDKTFAEIWTAIESNLVVLIRSVVSADPDDYYEDFFTVGRVMWYDDGGVMQYEIYASDLSTLWVANGENDYPARS